MKGLAIAMVLAMVGMAVMPMAVGKLGYYIAFSSDDPAVQAFGATGATIGAVLIGLYLQPSTIAAAAALGPVGWVAWGIGFACSVGAVY